MKRIALTVDRRVVQEFRELLTRKGITVETNLFEPPHEGFLGERKNVAIVANLGEGQEINLDDLSILRNLGPRR